jgi:uncharacterized YigZ family protein
MESDVQVSAKGPERQAKERSEHEIEKISGSRFIATVLPVTTPELVIDVQKELRTQHPHCRHVCFAYVGAAALATRHSDDGEPGKTAGIPMLRVLLGASLRNTAVLVVRYFGGVKLGTGGLVRAYTQSAREAIEHTALVPVVALTSRRLELGYADEPRARHFCDKGGVSFEVTEFGGTKICAMLRGEPRAVDEVLLRLAVK